MVFSSPLNRCTETVNELFQNVKPILDKRLLEFNYGSAEGLSYRDLSKKFPNITNAWAQGKDPPFPKGESTKDVFLRLNSFMNYLKNEILLKNLNIKKKHWHMLEIPFRKSLEILFFNGNFHSNISRNILSTIMRNFELKV